MCDMWGRMEVWVGENQNLSGECELPEGHHVGVVERKLVLGLGLELGAVGEEVAAPGDAHLVGGLRGGG